MKSCKLCKVEKTDQEYYVQHKRNYVDPTCKECRAEIHRNYKNKPGIKERIAQNNKEYRKKPEVIKRVNANSNKYYHQNKHRPEFLECRINYQKRFVESGKSAEYQRKWKAENLEWSRARFSKYCKDNRGKLNAKQSKRRAAHLEATPKWLTAEQIQEMEQFYIDAKECQWLSEEPLQVDHIVPLQGENVRGLHVPWNLRVIPASKNRAKGNKL